MKKYVKANDNSGYILFELTKYDLEPSRLSKLGERCVEDAIRSGDLLIASESEDDIFSEELYYYFAIRKGADSSIAECLKQMEEAAGFILPVEVKRSSKNIRNFKIVVPFSYHLL